jgi:hypothetical protein
MQQLHGRHESGRPAAQVADQEVVTLVGEEGRGRREVDRVIEQGGGLGDRLRRTHHLHAC